ncbi:vesicular inhibitory amino acid transporter-like [Nelusetta ayraudi]|uniref:vesicular inhibitory amino acid transporter-like n=1 Tax=Nelusetta ayraudi TaxID=303726 RepID=UPI003F70C6B9
MDSLLRARSSGQPLNGSGSLWGWLSTRLRLDWSTRFFEQDEEMLILTQSDEISRTYNEDQGLPVHVHATRNAIGGATKTRPEGATPNLTIGASWQDSQTFKETRATVISSGPSTVTITSALPPADWLSSGRSYCIERRCAESEGDGAENPHFIQEQGSKNKRKRAHRLAGPLQDNMQNKGFSGYEGGGEGDEEGGSSQSCTSLEEERTGTTLANPAQSPSGKPPNTISAWEAGWNVTNAIQGIFVLGLPFALVHSGYVGLILMVLSAWVCNHTGRILVACLYEEKESRGCSEVVKVRVRHSYEDVVEACCKGLWPNWPGLGGCMVNIAQVVELLMTCTLYLVVSTSLMSDSLSGAAVPRSMCSLVSLMFLLPCLLLTDLRPVSTLSLLCSLAHILISLLVMLHCLSRASSWSWTCLSLSVDPEDFLVSVGVIIFSYTSQIFLPPLEGSMEDRGQFDKMLQWTHGAACIMKTLFSLLAVLTWGADTSEVITDNLPSDLRPLVNLCLLAKALLSYPLPFYSAAEILQSCLLTGSGGGGGGRSHAALMVRTSLLMSSFLLALLVPRFSLLMGLTGSVTGAAMTLVLPCLFHLRLHWGRLATRERLLDMSILSFGVACSVSGLICSAKRLVEGL